MKSINSSHVCTTLTYTFFYYRRDYRGNCINNIIVKHLFMIINFNNLLYWVCLFTKNTLFKTSNFLARYSSYLIFKKL